MSAAKNLPKIILVSLKGFVSKNSKVPCFFSSATDFIVIAGMRNISNHGTKINIGSKEAIPLRSRLNSVGKNHKNRLKINRNNPITVYPTAERKKLYSSLYNSANIFSVPMRFLAKLKIQRQ
jgi:hypothetical protein